VAASTQYLEYADDLQFDILGTEAYIANPGLTLGGWFWCDAASMGVLAGFISKYLDVGNQRAYALYKTPANTTSMLMSTDGINNVQAVHPTAIVVDTWNHIIGRFTPSAEIAIFLNGIISTNVAAIPASIFDSNASLQIGNIRDAGSHYLDGRASQCFICAAALSDAQIGVLYQQTRAMLGV
jgi:hypothetical protein